MGLDMRRDPACHFTGILSDIARASSPRAALEIAREYGGTKLYIPKAPAASHPLSLLVGHAAAQAIGEALSVADAVLIPIGPFAPTAARWRRLNEMLDRDMTKPQIARALGIHMRTVQRHRNGGPKTKAQRLAQGDLFEAG